MSNGQAPIEQKFDPGRILSSKAILMRIDKDCDFKTFVDNSIVCALTSVCDVAIYQVDSEVYLKVILNFLGTTVIQLRVRL